MKTLYVLALLCFATAVQGKQPLDDQCHGDASSKSCAAQTVVRKDKQDDETALMQTLGKIAKVENDVSESAGAGADIINFAKQLHARGSKRLSLVDMKSFAAKLAEKVVDQDYRATPTDDTIIQTMKDYINTMLDNVVNAHDEDQTEVNAAKDLIQDCVTDTETLLSGTVANFEQTAQTAREAHASCRTEEATKHDDMTTGCAPYTATLFSTAQPSCISSLSTQMDPADATQRQCFEDLQAWLTSYQAWLTPLRDKSQLCKDRTASHGTHNGECNTKQRSFESSTCAHELENAAACAAQDTCRARTVAARDTTHARVAVSESARKSEYGAGKMALCYLAVLEANETEKPEKFKECQDLTVGTSQFDVSYPDMPAEYPCESVSPATCDATWKSDEYESQTWFSKVTMDTCQACPTPAPSPGTPTVDPACTSGTLAKDCVDVKRCNPSASDGFYKVKPTPAGISVRANEDVTVPADGVSIYCRFEGNNAWGLVGTFKDGASNSKWASGGYNFAVSPQPDDSSAGTTTRFPFSFWNDMAQGLPTGAITHTSTVSETADAATSYCPGFWKTSCQIYHDNQALTPECAEPWKTYSNGVFTDMQYDRSEDTGYTDGHGAILGYTKANKVTSVWTGTLILTGFQGGSPALGKCRKSDGSYLTYSHNMGFFFWIGGYVKAPTPAPQALYELISAGMSCPSNYEAIVSESMCQAAATAMANSWGGAVNWPSNNPSGCIHLDGEMWFNEHNNGELKRRGLVCKQAAAPAPTPAPAPPATFTSNMDYCKNEAIASECGQFGDYGSTVWKGETGAAGAKLMCEEMCSQVPACTGFHLHYDLCFPHMPESDLKAAGFDSYPHWNGDVRCDTNPAGISFHDPHQCYKKDQAAAPPPVTSTLYGHWDATVSGSVTTDGDRVSGWADQSGQNLNLEASGASRPQFVEKCINGHPAIRFPGSGDVGLASTEMHPTHALNPFTWIVVTVSRQTAWHDNIFSTNDAPWSSLNQGHAAQWRSIAFSPGGVHGWSGPSDVSDAVMPHNTLTVGTLWFDGTRGKIYHGTSLVKEFTPSSWDQTKQGYVVVGHAMQNHHEYSGDVGEILAYTTALPEQDVLTMVNHLQNKWQA